MPTDITRRDLVAAAVAMAAGSALGCRRTGSTGGPPGRGDLVELSAVDAVAAMRAGDVSAEDYATALLDRARSLERLNAFITLDPDLVLEAARGADQRRASGARLGALHGLPIPIKDSVNTADLPTTGGTPALRAFRPRQDAPLVASLRAAGGIVMGKTNIHELSFGWTSNNLAFGPVRNPYDLTRIPGGSTGGTAAAIAARIAPLGVAEDTEGSIRVPAAMCGIAGFRPTTGRYPTSGVIPISPLFDQVGPHARTVGDLVLFDQVAAGDPASLDPRPLAGVRLGVDRGHYFEGLDSEVERITAEALRKLTDAGAVLVERPVPGLADLIARTTGPVQVYDVLPSLRRYLAEHDAGVTFEELLAQASVDVRRDFESFVLPGARYAVPDSVFEAARDVHLPALRETFRQWFAETGAAAIVFPTTRVPATPIGQDEQVEINGVTVSFMDAVSRNIAPGSTTGLPGLVLPSGMTSGGLPVSIELDGPAGQDRALLALGLSIERVLGPIPAPEIPAAAAARPDPRAESRRRA